MKKTEKNSEQSQSKYRIAISAISTISVVCGLVITSNSYTALAQSPTETVTPRPLNEPNTGTSTPKNTEQRETTPSRTRLRNAPKAGKRAPTSNTTQPNNAPNNAPDNEASTANTPSAWFPDWPAASFDFFGAPILAFQYSEDGDVATTALEGGIMAGLEGIPVAPGNPGLSLAPSASYALGNLTVKSEGLDLESEVYHRGWVALKASVPVRFYRHVIGVKYGLLQGKNLVPKRRSLGVDNNLGILILPFLSTHYSHSYNHLHTTKFSEKLFTSHDNWLYARFFAPLPASIAFGPGVEFSDTYLLIDNSSQHLGSASTTYFKLQADSKLFWKFGAGASFRYAVAASSDLLINNQTAERLPTQALNDPPAYLGQPFDSLVGDIFVGINNLYGPIGFGWRYSLRVRNLFEKEGKRSTTSEQGVGLQITSLQ